MNVINKINYIPVWNSQRINSNITLVLRVRMMEAWRCSSMAECLPCVYRALSLMFNTKLVVIIIMIMIPKLVKIKYRTMKFCALKIIQKNQNKTRETWKKMKGKKGDETGTSKEMLNWKQTEQMAYLYLSLHRTDQFHKTLI